jgi:putative phosphoribosyl transferase
MKSREVTIRIGDGAELTGDLTLPDGVRGLVVFAHGSGSSRHSPRNRYVAGELNRGGLGTLLVDLLTPEEERVDAVTAQLRFDIGLLAERLADVVGWAVENVARAKLKIGLFGASTGAAAALICAAERGDTIGAVISRGGRPDLAGAALAQVTAPTLLIVGGDDVQVLTLNRDALAQLECSKRLAVVARATHLFSEPRALERVAELARDWFVDHLAGAALALPGGEPARPS